VTVGRPPATRVARLRRRRGRASFVVVLLALAALGIAAAGYRFGFLEGDEPGAATGASPAAVPAQEPKPPRRPSPSAEPINTEIAGLTTFRGNATRTYYGEGPVPRRAEVLWRFPPDGGLCSRSSDEEGTRVWCGTGWTGQPNVVEPQDGPVQVRFGAFDGAVHILDAGTGQEIYEPFPTGDLIKGTVTSDPEGYPLLYVGSRDNYLRILALDRGDRPVELWRLSSDSAPSPLWNNDWDGSPLVIGDYLLEGGENSWFYVIRLHRGYDDRGLVTVRPKVRLVVPGYDDRLLADLGDSEVSIEGSVAFADGVAYFANSGGLVQGWDVSGVLEGGGRHERVFRFWTGEDTDASVVLDEEGSLYVASELERHNVRSTEVGQLLKLDPGRPGDPVVWDVDVPGAGGGAGGMWATPALYRDALFVTTNTGRLLAVDRDRGTVAWEISLSPPTWSSPVVVDGVLIVGDCGGTLHAFDLRPNPLAGQPHERWEVDLGGCIESTPAVWRGTVYVGTRGGGMFAVGRRS